MRTMEPLSPLHFEAKRIPCVCWGKLEFVLFELPSSWEERGFNKPKNQLNSWCSIDLKLYNPLIASWGKRLFFPLVPLNTAASPSIVWKANLKSEIFSPFVCWQNLFSFSIRMCGKSGSGISAEKLRSFGHCTNWRGKTVSRIDLFTKIINTVSKRKKRKKNWHSHLG